MPRRRTRNLQAIKADPTWSYPVYQLACNYELWNQTDRAWAQFVKAVDLGFDDFPTALVDDELGQMRNRTDFKTKLRKIRERYIASSSQESVSQSQSVPRARSQPAAGRSC